MIKLPEKCLRGMDRCMPLSQLQSDCGRSFMCCGENDGSDREYEQDKYTVCFKNDIIDERTHWDKRDITDTASVLIQALSIIENKEHFEKRP